MYHPFQTSRRTHSNYTIAQTEERKSLMKTKILVSLTALPILLSALTLAPVSAAPSPQASIQATIHGTSLTLRGTNFAPSTRVGIAVIDARSWHVVATARVTTEPATYNCPTGASVFCGQADPAAGQLDARITVRAPSGSLLHLLYRAGNDVGFLAINRR
jgi:hypothetical protein